MDITPSFFLSFHLWQLYPSLFPVPLVRGRWRWLTLSLPPQPGEKKKKRKKKNKKNKIKRIWILFFRFPFLSICGNFLHLCFLFHLRGAAGGSRHFLSLHRLFLRCCLFLCYSCNRETLRFQTFDRIFQHKENVCEFKKKKKKT